jgi:hypothetical protein
MHCVDVDGLVYTQIDSSFCVCATIVACVAMACVTPAIHRGMVVIEGGFIRGPWPVRAEEADGVSFLSLSRQDRKLASFLGFDLASRAPLGSFGFLDKLVCLRNDAVDRAMSELASADPMQDSSADSPLKAPRGELVDLIPRVVEISVVLGDDDPVCVKVLSTSSKKAAPSVELCDATLALLLKGAKAQVPSKRKTPNRSGEGSMHIAEANVHWCPKRGAVYCSFTDVNGTKRMRHMTVKKSDVPERYAENVAAAAATCQQHYDDNNVNPPTSDD